MHNLQLKDKNSVVKWKKVLEIQVEKVLQEFSQQSKEKIEGSRHQGGVVRSIEDLRKVSSKCQASSWQISSSNGFFLNTNLLLFMWLLLSVTTNVTTSVTTSVTTNDFMFWKTVIQDQ